MIYATGDIHGSQFIWDACIASLLNEGDTIIVGGDFGIGFFDGEYWTEEIFFDYLAEQKYTVLFCDGNHENFNKLNEYEVSEWSGGRVHRIRENVIHLMRGEVYVIDGNKIFVMGGGFSLDKELRVSGYTWWPEEMPCDEEYKNATKNLKDNDFKVDYIITHTAPCDIVEYMSTLGVGIKNNVTEELLLTGYLQWVAETVEFEKWYFGHFHIDREIKDKYFALLDGIRELETGKLVKMRMPHIV